MYIIYCPWVYKILENANWSIECLGTGWKRQEGGISSGRLKLLGVLKHMIFLNVVMMHGFMYMSDLIRLDTLNICSLCMSVILQQHCFREFLEGPVVKTCALTAKGPGSSPGWGTKIPRTECYTTNKQQTKNIVCLFVFLKKGWNISVKITVKFWFHIASLPFSGNLNNLVSTLVFFF